MKKTRRELTSTEVYQENCRLIELLKQEIEKDKATLKRNQAVVTNLKNLVV